MTVLSNGSRVTPQSAPCAWAFVATGASAASAHDKSRGRRLMISHEHSCWVGPMPVVTPGYAARCVSDVATGLRADARENRSEVLAARFDAEITDDARLALGHRNESHAEP